MFSTAGMTQATDTNVVSRASEQKKQKQSKRQPARPPQEAQAPVLNARAQIGGAPAIARYDYRRASKTEERAIDAPPR